MRIGYIGLGNMGAPMARNLHKAGYDLQVFDLSPEKREAAAAAGIAVAASAEELAGWADALLTSLPEPKHVRAAVPGWIELMRPGSVWVDLTTNDRDLVLKIKEQAEARGVFTVESPVTGAVDGARRGKLTLFVGADAEQFARIQPVLEVLGRPIHCGAHGTGNAVKLVTNQVWFINAIAMGEAFVLGKKAGVELDVLWEALKSSVGDTFVMRHDAPSVFAGHYDPSFALALCCKDLRLLAELGEETGSKMDLTLLAREKFEEAMALYGPEAAELLVCKVIEEASGTDLRLEGAWQKHWEVE